ncbi:MAG: sugar ABC transporter substrate-binding protein [Caldilineaceae bacterium]|nr:sugar ABC transporter substrate-binding protein [Caldilineaceae bacterium]
MRNSPLSRRQFLRFSAGVAGLAALSACAPAAAPSAGGDANGGAAASGEAVNVSLGLTWEAAFQSHQKEFDDKFMEAHPDITLEPVYNTWSDHNNVVPTWAAADTLPDIIYVHGSRAFPWAFEGITIPLQSYIDTDTEFNVEDVWAEALNLYNFKGEQHGIPYDHGPNLLGYNKDMFDAAGIAYPDETWTMDTLRETALQLTDAAGEVPKWGWSAEMPGLSNQDGVSSLGPWGAELLNTDENTLLLDTDAALESTQYWTDLILVDKSAPTPAESQAFEQGPWIAGQVGMAVVPSWETPSLASFSTFAWDVAPWPEGPVARATGSFGSGFSMTKNTQHPDQDWAYLREYLSKEGMEFMWGSSGRGSPARKSAYDSWMNSDTVPEHVHYYLDALDTYAITGRPYQTLAAAELNDIITRSVTLLKSGETDVASALAAIMEEGAPVLTAAYERLNS